MSDRITDSETFRELLSYDPDNGEFKWKERQGNNSWNARWANKPAFIHKDYGDYLRASIMGRFYSAHRVAWSIFYGCEAPDFIDHIDGDRQNNRIMNLRKTDFVGNSKNRGVRSDNTSGRTGVHMTKSGTYKVRIFANGKDNHVGTFKLFQDAVEARRKAEKDNGFFEGHGERIGTPWKRSATTYGLTAEDVFKGE